MVSDGPTRLTIARLVSGTQVFEHRRRVAVAGPRGVASVRLTRGTTVLTLVRPGSTVGGPARRTRPAPAFTG